MVHNCQEYSYFSIIGYCYCTFLDSLESWEETEDTRSWTYEELSMLELFSEVWAMR